MINNKKYFHYLNFFLIIFINIHMEIKYDMENLPNKSEKSLQMIFNLFKNEFKTIEDINNIFFNNKCYFLKKISKDYSDEGKRFVNVFGHLKQLIFDIEKLFPEKGIRTLKTGENGFVKLTRKQAALVFLLSFFNLILIKESNKKNYFNIHSVLEERRYGTLFEFGRCFLNYLTVIGEWLSENNSILNQEIIYSRKNIVSMDYLSGEDKPLCDLKIINKGSMFDGDAFYCIDFANKYIGGGVLNGGCVQEEILFAVEPEAIVSLFFMEVMDNNDAIGIYNTIQYSDYQGYGYNFSYKNCLIDGKTRIKMYRIIAIDALPGGSSWFSFFNNDKIIQDINRDLHKAFVGFSLTDFDVEKNNLKKTIATGNWGCGAFGGNHELKFIQQWIAASFAGIERLNYYTFSDNKMINVEKNFEKIKNKFKSAKDLYNALISISGMKGSYIDNILRVQNE